MYARPPNSQGNLHISKLSVENSYTEINATQSPPPGTPSKWAKLTEEQRQYRIDNNLCFYCRQEGHSIFDCQHPDKKPPRRPMIRQVFSIKENNDKMDQYEVPSFPASPL